MIRLRLDPRRLGPGLPLRLERVGEVLQGEVRWASPGLGTLSLPFRARLEGEEIKPLALPAPSLSLSGRLGGEMVLEVHLPEGAKWGERALARILEYLLARALMDPGGGAGV